MLREVEFSIYGYQLHLSENGNSATARIWDTEKDERYVCPLPNGYDSAWEFLATHPAPSRSAIADTFGL